MKQVIAKASLGAIQSKQAAVRPPGGGLLRDEIVRQIKMKFTQLQLVPRGGRDVNRSIVPGSSAACPYSRCRWNV